MEIFDELGIFHGELRIFDEDLGILHGELEIFHGELAWELRMFLQGVENIFTEEF